MEEHRRNTRSIVVVAILVVVRMPMVEHGKDLAGQRATSAYAIASLPSRLFTNPARAQLPLNLIYCFMSC